MATKTVLITSGATWTLPSDAYGTLATIICFGAGQNGQSGFFGGCTGPQGGNGGISGCVAQKTSLLLPSSGSVPIQIPAGGSVTDCWFNDVATVLAKSAQTTTTGCIGDIVRGGSTGGAGSQVCGNGVGGGGAGAPGVSTGGGNGSGSTGGAAGTPNYSLTVGGTAGPGAGGNGSSTAGAPGGNYGAAGSGGGYSGCTGAFPGGAGAPGAIIVIYTLNVWKPPFGFDSDALAVLNTRMIAG